MFHNPTQLDSYNKYPAGTTQGTLVANWHEQRALRQHEGQGRSLTKTHLPKQHHDLYASDTLDHLNRPSVDNTSYRVMGYQQQPQLGQTQNYSYGKGTNKAEQLPRVGRKQQLLQQMYLQEARAQIRQRETEEREQANRRTFNTTHADTFVKHDTTTNVVGRRVMQDQDRNKVPFENIDEDLKIDKGFYQRKQITPDEELKKLLPQGHYSKQQPITFWKQKLQDGTFYHSKIPANGQDFAKNNEFLKTFQHYKHYKD